MQYFGGGFKHIFPKQNEELFYEILKKGGCIVSEYAPDMQAESKNCPKRNRIVSGLSDGVLVVEARYRSGTSITAKFAKEQGKPIFCIPSNINCTTGYGTGILIRKGAKLVLSPENVLQEFGVDVFSQAIEDEKVLVDKKYQSIYDAISRIPTSIVEICKTTHKNIEEVNVALTMLELQGVIKAVGGNQFIKV